LKVRLLDLKYSDSKDVMLEQAIADWLVCQPKLE